MAVKYVKDFEFSKDAGFSASCKPVKKAMGGVLPSMKGKSIPRMDRVPLPSSKSVRTTEFRDANRNGIDDRDELRAAQRMNTRLRSRMQRPRVDRRGRAMIGREDERMLDMDRVRSRTPKAPGMRPYMPEYDISPEEIREYSRGRTFAPEAMMKKGGSVKFKKIAKVMREYKKGELHSGSKKGPVVKNPKQAMEIALSEARKTKKAKGGEVKKAKKEEGKKNPKMKVEDLALNKMRHAEKYAPGMDLDNIHSYELSQEAKKEKKVEQYAKGGEVKKAVHKHEKAMHPGKPLTKLKKGGLPVHKGSPMYGRK